TGNVRSLADHHEVRIRPDDQRLQPGEPRVALYLRQDAGCGSVEARSDGADVIGRGAAATSDGVDQPLVGQLADERRSRLRRLVVLAEGVRQAGVRVAADEGIG